MYCYDNLDLNQFRTWRAHVKNVQVLQSSVGVKSAQKGGEAKRRYFSEIRVPFIGVIRPSRGRK